MLCLPMERLLSSLRRAWTAILRRNKVATACASAIGMAMLAVGFITSCQSPPPPERFVLPPIVPHPVSPNKPEVVRVRLWDAAEAAQISTTGGYRILPNASSDSPLAAGMAPMETREIRRAGVQWVVGGSSFSGTRWLWKPRAMGWWCATAGGIADR